MSRKRQRDTHTGDLGGPSKRNVAVAVPPNCGVDPPVLDATLEQPRNCCGSVETFLVSESLDGLVEVFGYPCGNVFFAHVYTLYTVV
jgi:hypothetical protein